MTQNETIRKITADYLADDAVLTKTPEEIEQDLLETMNQKFKEHNAMCEKGDTRWHMPTGLLFSQIADIMMRLYTIKRINCSGSINTDEYDLLAIYQTTGRDEGIYVTDDSAFRTIARQYNYNLTTKDFNECMVVLKDNAPRTIRNTNRDLVAVNNGIFNYRTKQLMPFDPKYVFLTKSRIDYRSNPANPVIHNPDDNTDWDVESWMKSLSDDPEIVNVLWEILSAIIRPNVRWNKSAWLYSDKGNNGKGTLCELMRSLCGEGSYASIPIADFGKDFLLEPLISASAIIVDENDVGLFIDKAANLKAIITNDVIQINRKFKQPVPYQFHGFMVQCLNEMPRIKDKSDSFYRRQLFIPMEKCFTGHERKYIKNDYLHRQEVLEYVLHKVLNTDFYQLSEPAACKNALEEYKEFNDPVRQFWGELHNRFAWDVLPYNFLFDLYKAWYAKSSPEGKMLGRNVFIQNIANVISKDPEWAVADKQIRVDKVGSGMKNPEPMILEFGLKEWMNPLYVGGKNVDLMCTTKQLDRVRGLMRVAPKGGDQDA